VLEQAPARTCGPMERGTDTGGGLLAGLVIPPMLEQQFLKDCAPWEGPTLGQGKSVRSPLPEEEGAAETTCDELTVTPVPRPPVPLVGRR